MTHSITQKKTSVLAMLFVCMLMSVSIAQVRAAANDSSITLKEDPTSKRFTLTIKDPDGIQEFSLKPAVQFPYGGSLSSCPKSFSITEVSFIDPTDFEPTMPAYVIDCKNNTANLEIARPKDNVAKSTPVIQKEEATPTPKPLSSEAPKEEQKKEQKAGSLSVSDISYPVRELGDCQDEAACRSYCDNSQHAKECFAFAKKYNLISEKETKDAEDTFLKVNHGPGGCNSGASCETYCNSVDHLDECIDFAEKNDYYSGDQLAEAKKFRDLVKSGTQFPGGCKDRNTCEVYCNDSKHMEECLNFAERAGFLPQAEIEEARKVLPFMQKGETPGGCTSKEQCEKYCSEDSHAEECITFGQKAGLISPEDAEIIKKTGGKGPGGCRSKGQCDAYCEDNSDECFQWAQNNGMISEADVTKMKGGLANFREHLDQMPPEVTQCLKDAVGEKNFEKLANGEPIFDRSLEGKMKSCFNEITGQLSKQLNTMPPEAAQCIKDAIGEEGLKKLQSGEFDQNVDFNSLEGCFQQLQTSFGEKGGSGGSGSGGGFAGPGGCKSIEECTAYCKSNLKECGQFIPSGGGGGASGEHSGNQGGFGGPGGCKSQEECMAYCKDHPDECKNVAPPGGGSDGFTSCGIVEGASAAFVCGINGKGAEPGVETTYFNECHAKAHGAEVLHNGVCKGHSPCSDVAHPVCGTDGGTYTDVCIAKEHGAGVKHEGVCASGDNGGGGRGFNGPGGCNNVAECRAYCTAHTSDPVCAAYIGGGSGGGFSGGPGGCQNEAECRAYCQAHYTDPGCGGRGMPTPPPNPRAQSCVPPPSGLVSWWNADAESGSTALDIIGGNNGAMSDGAAILGGKVGRAFQFSGTSGYVTMGNPASLNFGTGPFSLEAWFNWDGAGSSVNNIIRKSNYGGDPGSGYWVRIGRDNKTIEFSVGATTVPEGQTLITAPVSPGVWHHIAATRDGSDVIKLYIDGQSTGSFLRQAPHANSSSGSSFALGIWQDQNSEHFSGLIDEVSVYNRALDASEVKAIFNAGSAGKCSGSSSSVPSIPPVPPPQYTPPNQSPYPQSGGSIPQEYLQQYCPSFANAPSCSYVGAPDSQNYKYCKQCFPDK